MKNSLTRRFSFLTAFMLPALFAGCKKEPSQNEIWIYTSLYKDTIADLQPKLEADFPGVKFNFFQAGSEEIATRVNAEMLAGGTKADLMISSDRFWYEDLARQGKLHAFKPKASEQIDATLRHPQGFYTALSIPVMVLAFNTDAIPAQSGPKSFHELTEEKWKGQFSTGSPLESGTNFTTVAFLQAKYGWDFFKKLKANNTISQGGNSAVIRRIQNKERPVGWVLLENLLRFQGQDERLQTVLPEDGVVIHNNVLAIVKKDSPRELAEKVADWLFSQKGQDAMVRSYMYSPIAGYAAPQGAPPFADLQKKAMPWSSEFLEKTMTSREEIKEKFTEIMFH